MSISGTIGEYFVVFGAGVLVSFTPCVYPILPLTASFIAGMNTQGSRFRGFFLSLIYVFGLAITYSFLGATAAFTGKIFGQIQNHPAVYLVVANILIFFSLTMFDVIQLPTLNFGLQNKIKLKNLWSVVLFGMASGFVVGPCTAPVLGTILGYVGSNQNVVHGMSLLFTFSYGVGTSVILVGTFSGLLSSLPKSGLWLVRVKQLCGVILLIAAEYFLIKAGELLL